MSSDRAVSATVPSTEDLTATVDKLRARVEELEEDKRNLELVLDTATAHGDAVSEALEDERKDLETMLEMTTEHADVVEDELHERAAEAVLRNERQLRMIVEATPVPVFISRLEDADIVYANAMMGTLFAVPTEDLLGPAADELFHEPAQSHALIQTLLAGEVVDRQEVRLNGPAGATVWAELSLRLLDFNDERSILSALHDITHLREMNEASNRFVPNDYLSFLDKDSITDIALGDYITGEMTVMFSDLRGFTSVSEGMTPEENFAFINSYLGRVSPVIRMHNGFIIKYLGDGIHAIFPQLADDGVKAGIETLREVNAYNDYRCSTDRLPIAVGIGVNTGSLMVGMVGEKDRMQGDSFSDDVNLTARIEGLTKFYSVSFIISEATYERLADPGHYHIRYLDKVQVVGRANALNLYEVFDADPPEVLALKEETKAEYDEALEHYYGRDFNAAQAKLFGVMQSNPRDKVAWHHLVNATRLADDGAPVGWTGVTVMTRK